MLDLAELKSCTKSLKSGIKFNGTTKQAAIESILKHARSAVSVSKAFGSGLSVEDVILKQ